MNDIINIVQALEDFNVSLQGVTKTIKNETKDQKGGFLSMLLGTLGPSLLGKVLAGRGIVRAGSGNKKWKGFVRSGLWKGMGVLMVPHPSKTLKCKSIIRMNQDLMVLFPEIILLKRLRMGYT